MIIDSHCHLTYEPMFKSLEETIRRANKDGVKYFLTISTEDKSYKDILRIVEKISSLLEISSCTLSKKQRHSSNEK